MADKQAAFRCLYCSEEFDSQSSAAEHLSTVHRDVTVRKEARKRSAAPDSQVPQQGRQQEPSPAPPAVPGSLAWNPASTSQPPPPPPPTLPPLPANITNLGLTARDFNPHTTDRSTTLSINNYIDIPPFYAIADEHMFRACPRRILGFGNLLRLATRYSNQDLLAKINRSRPEAVMTISGLRSRIKRAFGWAAGKEWFPPTAEEVKAWFEGQRRANGIRQRADVVG